MPQATLIDVIRLAYNNPMFLDALLQDVDKALRDAGLELDVTEMKKLTTLLSEPIPNTGRQIMQLFSQINAREIDKTAAQPGPFDPW